MSRVALFVLICAGLAGVSLAQVVDPDENIWLRGDADGSGSLNATDIIFLSNYLYSGGPQPPCMAKADVNDDGSLNAVDPIFLSNYLFNGGYAPPGQNGDTCP